MRLAPLALAPLLVASPVTAAPELVADLATGQVIHAKEAQRSWHPASLTKLMTTYVALKAIASGSVAPDAPVTVSAVALRAPPSRSGLPLGTRLALGDALKVLMVKSANDLAIGIAEAVGGDVQRFVATMNSEARNLGMDASVWRNPHGLHDPDQVTTARDMAVLASALAKEFPTMSTLFGIGAVNLNGAVMTNHNNAIGRFPDADGMKTGYICASGFNVVTTVSRQGRRLVAVVLGQDRAMQRDALATLLLQAGLQAAATTNGGSLSSMRAPSGPRPPARACGAKSAPDEGTEQPAREAMAQWVRSFAAIPRTLQPPVAIRILGPTGPAMAAVAPAARVPEILQPPRVAIPEAPSSARAYAPLEKATSPIFAPIQATAPRRF